MAPTARRSGHQRRAASGASATPGSATGDWVTATRYRLPDRLMVRNGRTGEDSRSGAARRA